MVICGNILVRDNYEEFVLSCTECNNTVIIDKWQEFVSHVKSVHKKEEQQDAWESLSMASTEPPYTNNECEGEEEASTDCLAEAAFVDLPPMSDDDTFETESEEDAAQELDATSENDTAGTASYAATAKFNPTFYRRSPRITKFIELYKAQPCLWDPKDPAYSNKEQRALAYASLIEQLKATINVHLTHYKLKKSIANLHSQYSAVTRQKRTQKLTKVPLHYHELYGFLAKRGDMEDAESEEDGENDKIKLLFTATNPLTTLFIDVYAKFPQLYDPAHESYASVGARKAAYVAMMELLSAYLAQGNIAISHNDVYDSVLRLRQWYCRKIKGLTEVQTVGLLKAEKLYIEQCKGFLTTKTFRQKLPCEVCQSSFSTDHALQAHLYRAHKLGEWPFKCAQCESSFERRCHLQQHNQRVHIGKLFNCGRCERSFAFASHLSIHLRTHDETHIAKPFVCEFCGKSFKQKIQMSNHVTAVHTKIRAFKCHICPKDFLTKRDLTDHIKAHLNIRDKVCETCQKAFTNANALVKHRHIHKEKTLQCSLCSTRFSERVSLGVHMKRTHKIIRNNSKLPEPAEAAQ